MNYNNQHLIFGFSTKKQVYSPNNHQGITSKAMTFAPIFAKYFPGAK
jgi:hypothetical protein